MYDVFFFFSERIRRKSLIKNKLQWEKFDGAITNDFSTVLAWPEVAAVETEAAAAAAEAAVARSAAVG